MREGRAPGGADGCDPCQPSGTGLPKGIPASCLFGTAQKRGAAFGESIFGKEQIWKQRLICHFSKYSKILRRSGPCPVGEA
jgi:hypothetical protein